MGDGDVSLPALPRRMVDRSISNGAPARDHPAQLPDLPGTGRAGATERTPPTASRTTDAAPRRANVDHHPPYEVLSSQHTPMPLRYSYGPHAVLLRPSLPAFAYTYGDVVSKEEVFLPVMKCDELSRSTRVKPLVLALFCLRSVTNDVMCQAQENAYHGVGRLWRNEAQAASSVLACCRSSTRHVLVGVKGGAAVALRLRPQAAALDAPRDVPYAE